MNTANEPIRILLADDHPIFRFGMRTLLTAMPDMTVVGEAVTGEEAVQLVETLLPDVVLMDIHMPGLNGIEATAHIRAQHPRTAVLIVTMLDDDSVFAAIRAGARGYLLKGAEPTETLRAIRAVASGEAIFSPGIAERVMRYFVHPTASSTQGVPLAQLSEREREVLILIAQGLTNTAIAERLVLSPKTVRNYISEIYSKLQVTDRIQAVLRAREAGLS
ncbi:MAG TPA: DNA-binding response regulator [Ktedonobacter sp.]|nr:DNA-binding response regulator [Ktedonobacter sp.]